MPFKYDPQWQGPLSGRSFEKQTEDAINYVLESAELAQASDSTPQAPSLNGSAGTSQEWSRGDHQHPVQTSISGNAVTASKLQTPVNITLTGDVSGQTAFDGSTSVTISTAIQNATQSSDGLMTSADKIKLDGIEAGANDYVLPAATASTLGGVRVDAQLNGLSANPVRNSAVKSGLDALQGQIIQKVALTGNQTVTGSKTFSSPILGNLNGNASTASKLQTARTISISGAATGSASFDGSANADIEVVRRSCVNRNTSSSPTAAPWFKMASYTGSATGNASITFLIENIYNGEAITLGHVDVRFNSGTVSSQSNVKFAWFFGQGTDVKVIVPDSDIRNTVEIWRKISVQYGAYRLTVLGEGNGGNSSNLWTLYSASSNGQAASVPAGWDISPAYYTPVDTSHDQTVSGSKTFKSTLIVDCSTAGVSIRSPSNSSYQMICGGRSNNGTHGATLLLYGADSSSAGLFQLHAGNSSQSKNLVGKADGTFTWDGQNIQVSSDERIKTPLADVPDDILDAWGDVQWGEFQYLDAVEAKGESARLHLGLIAQRVKAVFEARGLDACEYGILCHEERPAAIVEETVVDAESYVDEQGVEHPAVTHVETRHEDAVDLWMVRYAEAQAMEAAYQRRRADRMESRIAALEEKLS